MAGKHNSQGRMQKDLQMQKDNKRSDIYNNEIEDNANKEDNMIELNDQIQEESQIKKILEKLA